MLINELVLLYYALWLDGKTLASNFSTNEKQNIWTNRDSHVHLPMLCTSWLKFIWIDCFCVLVSFCRVKRRSWFDKWKLRGNGINAVLVPLRVVQWTVPFHPERPYLPRRYAINELHERIPSPPEIRREVATECVQEMSPVRGAGRKACSISPRQIIGPTLFTSKWC